MTNRYRRPIKEEAQHFAVSAGASAIGATAVYPIDLIKTRLQNQRKKLSLPGTVQASGNELYKGTWDCFRKIIKNEGPLRLYSGLVPNLVGQVPEKAIRLFVVEQVRAIAAGKLEKNKINISKKSKQVVSEVSAGMAAGTCQVFITNPSEVIKVRMQVASANKPTVFSLLRELGPKGLYRGASACFLRDIPFSGIYFPLYFLSKDFLSVSGPSSSLTSSSSFRLFFSASIAGLFSFFPSVFLHFVDFIGFFALNGCRNGGCGRNDSR